MAITMIGIRRRRVIMWMTTMTLMMLMTLMTLMTVMVTKVEFGQGSVTTVVWRRHRAFDDRAGDSCHRYRGQTV